MRKIADIITSGDIAFMTIANKDFLKDAKLKKLGLETIDRRVRCAQTRHSHVYVWITNDIPEDCAAIVLMRPEDARPLKDSNARRNKIAKRIKDSDKSN